MLRTRKYHKQSDTTSDEFNHKQNGHQRGDLEPPSWQTLLCTQCTTVAVDLNQKMFRITMEERKGLHR